MVNKRQINLLTTTSFEHSTVGKLISWASNIGRWIVVLTEFIVICAFLSRFYFDTKLANLFDEVRQKKAIVNSSYVFEEQYRQAQDKLNLAKIILANNSSSVGLITQISGLLPLDATLTVLSIDTNTLTLEGYSLSANSLKVFIDGLGQSPGINEIKVGKLTARPDGFPGINFSITAKINTKA